MIVSSSQGLPTRMKTAVVMHATRYEWKVHMLQDYATRYAPNDSITTAAAIEAIASTDTPIGRLVDGLSFLWYILLLIPLLLVFCFHLHFCRSFYHLN